MELLVGRQLHQALAQSIYLSGDIAKVQNWNFKSGLGIRTCNVLSEVVQNSMDERRVLLV